MKKPLGSTKTVSTLHKFKSLSASKIVELKTRQLKKQTNNKMQWGVRAYNDWRTNKLSDIINFDVKIFEADLSNVAVMPKESFIHAMCIFIAEVTKQKDGTDYPGKTLYEMVTSIQKYLNQNNIFWKLIDGPEFLDLHTVLDNVMKERAKSNIGLVKKQANFIPMHFENELWEKGVLGENTPDKLRDTVLFLLGINLGLHACEEHYDLRRDSSTKPSQLSFERSECGKCCLVYCEDTITKSNDGGLKSLKKDRKIIWIFPNENPVRCTVRLVDKYMSLLPPVGPNTRKFNFYLLSLEKINPAQWYGEQCVGKHTLRKVVGNLLKNANLDGYFTNHNLRCTDTRLFQADLDRKIIKEFTGHVSDAVDKYQVTSNAQREKLSSVLRGKSATSNDGELAKKEEILTELQLEVSVKDKTGGSEHSYECCCPNKSIKIDDTVKIGEMINSILSARKTGNAKIKLKIEFS